MPDRRSVQSGSPSRHLPWRVLLSTAAAFAIGVLVLLWTPWPALWAAASLLIGPVLPGWLLYRLWFCRHEGHHPVEAGLIAFGLGYAFDLIVTLALHSIPGQLTRQLSIGAYGAVVGILLAGNVVWPYRGRMQRLERRDALVVLGVAIIACATRLINLGYSEFQGDEVAVLHKAAAAIQGRDDVLFLHRKGPAEILLTLLPYSQGMATNEWGVRLPFALANVLAVLSLYELGRRAMGLRAAVWVAILTLLNGFFLAFGRIVQYQSLVLFLSTLGLLMALLYRQTRLGRYVWLCALFLALGTLAHTDAAFAAIPAAWLIISGLVGAGYGLGAAVRRLVGPLVLGLLLLAAFYVPYVSSDTFANTAGYLAGRLGDTPPYNNLGHLLEIGTVYNAVYYLALLGAVLLWQLMVRTGRNTPLKWVLPVALAVLMVQAVASPKLWRYQGQEWVGVLFVVLVVAAIPGKTRSPLTRPVLLWAGIPFVVFMFAFRDPRTHVYILFPGAVLLVAEQLAAWQTALGRQRWVVPTVAAPCLLMAAGYLAIVFISHQPEYRRTYPEHRVHAFWVPYGDDLPEQGLFGFPYRAGWKVIGQLYAQGVLSGDYETNEELHITRWYTRAQPTCGSDPRYYIMAANVQDERKAPLARIAEAYDLIGRVNQRGRTTLEIYELRPATIGYAEYDVESLSRAWDRQLSSPWYDTGQPRLYPLEGMQAEIGARFAEQIDLAGYAIDRRQVSAHESFTVTLYWQALGQVPEGYTVFVHVEEPGVAWAQKDTQPRCGNAPTDRWEPGEVVVDRHTVWIGDHVPTGQHELVVGLYRLETGDRLAVTGPDGQMLGDHVSLGNIDVQSRQ